MRRSRLGVLLSASSGPGVLGFGRWRQEGTRLLRRLGPSGACDKRVWLHAEAGLRPLDHRLRRPNLGLPNGSRRLDVDDHAVVGVDQIIGGVGEEGMAFVRAGPLRRRIGPGDELGRDG
jgi:hypothetical protein